MKSSRLHGLVLAASLFALRFTAGAADDLKSCLARLAKLEAAVTELKAENAKQKAQIVVLTAGLVVATAREAKLESALAEVRANPALALAPYLQVRCDTLNGLRGPHIIFEGANLHVRSGSGDTCDYYWSARDPAWRPLGLGNLIVGYNELRSDVEGANERTGSHCLVLGSGQNFTSVAGFLAGSDNSVTEVCGSVSGLANTAGAPWASIGGGMSNVVEGGAGFIGGGTSNRVIANWHISVLGGFRNTAGGWADVIVGGEGNETSPADAAGNRGGKNTISGGCNGIVTGIGGSITGGKNNIVSGDGATVTGGQNNEASGWGATVSGGANREATGDNDWVAGTLLEDN